jgi:hypothetical protein
MNILNNASFLVPLNQCVNRGYSLLQVSKRSHSDSGLIITLVERQLINPIGNRPIHWRFNQQQLEKIQTIVMLMNKYQLNLEGVELLLGLMEMNKALRQRVRKLETCSTPVII